MTASRHIIFGTAGHVDHGKSSLVLALTGTDPDRLAEEKAREMTIDLGFAFLPLPGLADPVAIVDVPGHEMFLRNMVAGATGIDAAIFVVAADEGVMPQTVEHLDVLRCLRVSEGVVALTKADKAPDAIESASAEVRSLVAGTFLERAKIIPVSSVTGEGLTELRAELARIALSVKARPAEGIFRLPIDRVFTLKGVGTVITGTVISGALKTGENVQCLPRGRELRVRGLQVHNEPADEIRAGQRAAINLADVSKDELSRGDVLTTPGALSPSYMIDARLELSQKAPRPLVQRVRLRIHHGTSEIMARLVLLDRETLSPGETALIQLRLEAPLVAAPSDAFVVRTYSPMLVIGGGSVIDPHPPKRRKAAGVEEVARREASPVAEVLVEALDRAGARGMDLSALQQHAGLADAALREELDKLKGEQTAVAGRRDIWYSVGAVREMQSAVTAALIRLHGRDPLRTWSTLNAVTSVSAPQPEQRECLRLALESLREGGEVLVQGERLRLTSHRPQWTGKPGAARESILSTLRTSGLAAPAEEELMRLTGLSAAECQRVLDALVDGGELTLLAKGVYLHEEAFARARDQVRSFLAAHRSMTIGECRDLLGASRKYLVPFLEELDRQGVTARQGEARVLKPGA